MRVSRLLLPLAALAALLIAASGPGTRLGLWHFRTGFQLLRWGAYLGMATAALALVALLVSLLRPRARAAGSPLTLAAALAVALAAAALPWSLQRQARGLPPIHDITTDLANPPAFVAVVPLRADAPNPVAYGGAEVAEAQRRAYPDVRPLDLAAPPAGAFARALDAARAMGWEIVAADSAAGRIEATATTRWFGFKDDVVVRVAPAAGGSRVDVRSVSRVGRGDVGANARRIREYVARLGA